MEPTEVLIPERASYVPIKSYKQDGHVRRSWDQAFVLEADEQHFVLVTNKARVRDDDGRQWFTREPALCYFYSDAWFNVIAMLRDSGVYYYCNLASPALYDGQAVKYIDYDLDYKIYPDGTVCLLDEDEYRLHSRQMDYPPQIDAILRKYQKTVIDRYRRGALPFDRQYNERQFNGYLEALGQ